MAGYVVGLTGGIGSGKSAASERFQALGIVVVDADVESRRVVEPGEAALDAIVARFGAGVLDHDGHLDRTQLRERVFQDADQRRWLERLLHPLINRRMAEQLHEQLQAAGIDALLDDRDERAGVKFADADLIGVPHRVTVGERALREGMVEHQPRANGSARKVPPEEILRLFG